MQTKHLTVMFTDIKGFTDKSSHKTREELLKLLEDHERLIRPIFEQFGGTVVKTIGDAFLVTFESPTDAVLCGVKIQEVLREHNQSAHPSEKFEVRVAANSGEVTVKDSDVFGEPVNIAARIEGIAEPNEVYFTEAVYLAMNKSEVPSAEVGLRHLKGIPNEIKVYKVLHEPVHKGDGVIKMLIHGPAKAAGGLRRNPLTAWTAGFAGAVLMTYLAINSRGSIIAALLLYGLYFYLSYSFYTLAIKLKSPEPWIAWIPLVNLFYCITVAKKPWYWYLLYLVSPLNLIFLALTWMAIAEARRRPRWLGLLILVPGVNLSLPGYLASVLAR